MLNSTDPVQKNKTTISKEIYSKQSYYIC